MDFVEVAQLDLSERGLQKVCGSGRFEKGDRASNITTKLHVKIYNLNTKIFKNLIIL